MEDEKLIYEGSFQDIWEVWKYGRALELRTKDNKFVDNIPLKKLDMAKALADDNFNEWVNQ